MSANAASQTSRILFGLLGTGAAGLLIGAFGQFWPAFAVDAATFFVSFALVSRIRAVTRVEGTEASSKGRPGVIFGQLREGIVLMLKTRMLLGTLVAAAVTMLGIGAVNVLIVPLIVNDLKVPLTWFGGIELAQTSAMIISGSMIAVLATRFSPTRIISLTLIVIGLAIAFISTIGSIWQLVPILFVVGFAVTPMQASISTVIQTSTEDRMRGRVGAALSTLISTSSLISMGLAGVLAEAIGVRNVFIVGGAITILAGLGAAVIYRGYTSNSEPQADTVQGQIALPQ